MCVCKRHLLLFALDDKQLPLGMPSRATDREGEAFTLEGIPRGSYPDTR
jgi:hypothetical protein